MSEFIVNFDDSKEAAQFLNQLRRLKGKYRIDVVSHRPRRTDRQNRYFHPCFCGELAKFLTSQGEQCTLQKAKDIIKLRCLTLSTTDRKTGELIEYVGRTRDLNTSEFNEFLDRAALYLWDTFAIQVPSPDIYYEKDPV